MKKFLRLLLSFALILSLAACAQQAPAGSAAPAAPSAASGSGGSFPRGRGEGRRFGPRPFS